jgi:Mn2+/Fe2+ NRAMP family transporter
MGRFWKSIRELGPGLVAGASDCDPTTVATMSVAGASTGYRLSLLTLLTYPMLACIQIISAQLGLVAKGGLQKVVKKLYGRPWSLVLLVSVLAVNVITIAADLEAGAAALALMVPIDLHWFVIPYAVLLGAILLLGSYDAVVRILKYVLLVFVAYILSAFLSHPQWGAILRATVLPSLSFEPRLVQAALAILGTSLTAYAYIWETQEEAEEDAPIGRLGHARLDAGAGIAVAVAMFWFILISTGTTLGLHHKQVETAQQAAAALKPIAGPFASYLFAAGLLASSFIAVPVLAASSSYLLGSEFGWRVGLSKKFNQARRFYGAVAVMLLIGAAVSFAGIQPIRLLFIASIAGGLGTPVGLTFLLLAARDRRVMHRHPIGGILTTVGWFTTALVAAVGLFFIWQQVGSKLLGH